MNGSFVHSQEATVSLVDPAIQAGIGVFETLAVREGRLLDWDAHLERLEGAAAHLAVRVPDRTVLAGAARTLAEEVAGRFGWLKIMALRGDHCAVFGGAMEPSEEGRSVSAVVLPWRRTAADPLTGLKSFNYAAFTLGLEEAARRGADEGLWLNTRGHLAEGSSSSAFVVRRRKLFTPSVRDGILPGVTRSLALEAARRLGVPSHEGKVRVKRMREADEIFLTSSVRGVRPVIRLDGRTVGDGKPGALTRAIAREVAGLREVWPPV